MMNSTPSGTKMHRESTEPKSRQVFFRQANSNLCDSLTMVYAPNNSIFHWAVHQPIAFFQVWSPTRQIKPLTEDLWLPLRRHFIHVYACAQTTKQRIVLHLLSNWGQMQPQLGIWERFIRSLLRVDRCSLSWGAGRGLLEVYQGWTDAASAGDLEEVY